MHLILQNRASILPGNRQQMNIDILEGGSTIFSMVYNAGHNTLRFESNGMRRLYMIYQEGRRHPKTVFKNEYGFDEGYISHKQEDTAYHSINFSGKRYYYNTSGIRDGQLKLSAQPDGKPLITLQMQAYIQSFTNPAGLVQFPQNFFIALVAGLCWLSQQVHQENPLHTPSTVISHGLHKW